MSYNNKCWLSNFKAMSTKQYLMWIRLGMYVPDYSIKSNREIILRGEND